MWWRLRSSLVDHGGSVGWIVNSNMLSVQIISNEPLMSRVNFGDQTQTGTDSILFPHRRKTLELPVGAIVSVAIMLGGAIGAAISRFFDKSNWREVAEARGAENEDLRHRIEDLEERVHELEAQVQGLAVLKSEQIAHLVLEGMESHRGD